MKITYTVIAKSIPEYSKRDGCLFTCTLGYCHESKSIIRVYPIPLIGMKKWETYIIDVEKNKRDTREESWKLSSYAKYDNWIGLDKDVINIGKMDRNKAIKTLLLTKQIFPSISILNNQKKSIGIVPINNYNLYWDTNSRFINSLQVGMFEDVELADFTKYTKETKTVEARIMFTGNDGQHDLQFNDWSVTEWYRKFGTIHPINDAFRFLKSKSYALLGNMHNYRNNWITLDLY
jgi:hypothetical protein